MLLQGINHFQNQLRLYGYNLLHRKRNSLFVEFFQQAQKRLKRFSVVILMRAKNAVEMLLTIKRNPCELSAVIVQKTGRKTDSASGCDVRERCVVIRTVEIVNFPRLNQSVLDFSQRERGSAAHHQRPAVKIGLGYNAFALIYRPGYDTSVEDLARAIAYLHDHAEELEIDMTDYSLCGGSAGARMAAWLGSHGTESYGEKAYPRPAAIIMQYTGLTEVTGNEPPTYNCVGTSDGIASYRMMQNRIDAIKANGTDTMIEVFNALPHGFGLGTGTIAEGWINNAVAFWERNMKG